MDQKLKAVALNCTLKSSPEESNTAALMKKVIAEMDTLGVETELIRVVDHNIKFGVSNDEGDGDEWPGILKKIKAADILIIGTPIWLGERGSVAQMVMERLDGTYADADEETGQYPMYGKVAGVVITGNEDGAHNAAQTILFNLTHIGFTIPPNADCYWVGDAGPGPSYIEAGGEKNLYSNRTARYLAHNAAYMARLLKSNPIPTSLKKLDEEAKKVSEG